MEKYSVEVLILYLKVKCYVYTLSKIQVFICPLSKHKKALH